MNVSARVSSIVNLRLGLVDDNFEVAAVLVFIADAFGIFIQLGGVVGACEEIFQENRMRNADGPQVLHGIAQGSSIDVLIALKLYLSYFDLGTLFYYKLQAGCGGWNLPNFGADRGKLPAVFRQQPFDGHFRFFDLRRVVLTLNRQSHFCFFEAIQNIAGGNRTQADVIDLADGRLFFPLNDQPPPLWSLFPTKLDVLEVAGIPQRIEITL